MRKLDERNRRLWLAGFWWAYEVPMAGLSISFAFLSRQYKGSKSKDTFLIRTVRFQAIQAILSPFLSCKNKGEKEKKAKFVPIPRSFV